MIKLEVWPVGRLKPYAENNKNHSDKDVKAIVASINRFGFNDPIGVKEDGTIVEGHGRLLAVNEIGLEFVPVLVLSGMTDAQVDRYRIAHNKIALNTGFNFEMLVQTIAEVTESGEVSITDMGFTMDSYNNICSMFAPEQAIQGHATTKVSHGHEYEIIWDSVEQKRTFESFLKKARAAHGSGFNGSDLLNYIETRENMSVGQGSKESSNVSV
jgi:hypothetical protein